MKKITSLTVILLSFSIITCLNAQISIGPKVGINIASAGGDDAPDNIESILGIQIGAVGEIGINEMFAVQPEILFFQKGDRVDGNPFDSRLILNYLEIPVLAKVKFGESEGTQFFATLGPSFGFGLGAKSKFGDNERDIDFDEAGLKSFDLGVSVGAGAQFPVGPGNLFADIRYLLGVITRVESGNATLRNQGLGIAVGFLFPVGGE